MTSSRPPKPARRPSKKPALRAGDLCNLLQAVATDPNADSVAANLVLLRGHAASKSGPALRRTAKVMY
jgi:hypothetical protein